MRACPFPVDPFALTRAPAARVTRDEDGWTVLIDAPGADPDDVKVDLDDHTLRVKVTVPADRAAGGERDGTYAITLPDGVTAESVTATVARGVVRIHVTAPPGRRASIPVTAG